MYLFEYLLGKEMMTEEQAEMVQTFEKFADVSNEVSDLYHRVVQYTSLTLSAGHLQKILDFEIMSFAELEEHLFDFERWLASNEMQMVLKIEDFVSEYAQSFTTRINKIILFEDTLNYTGYEIVKNVECEDFIYQQLEGYMNLTIGIAADVNTIKRIIKQNEVREDYMIFSDVEVATDDDILDSLGEFLNNTNGICTYKFNMDLDLLVPMYQHSAILHADEIYKLHYVNGVYEFDVLIIPSWDYRFVSKGEWQNG